MVKQVLRGIFAEGEHAPNKTKSNFNTLCVIYAQDPKELKNVAHDPAYSPVVKQLK
jgi:hypothetical protein